MVRMLGLVLCLPMLLIGCIDFGGGPDTDTVEIVAEEKSPNGKFIATSFSCAGGGAAGYFYFNASLRKAGEKLDQRDGFLGKHKTWKAFTDIEVRWIDDENQTGSWFAALELVAIAVIRLLAAQMPVNTLDPWEALLARPRRVFKACLKKG